MILDKALLLKGLAGVAAVGGAVGGGIYFREEIKGVFSSSSSSTGAAKPGGGGAANPATTEEDYGIPTKCNNASESSPCELTLEDLKKIKFEGLGEGGATADEVENFPSGNEKITLKIEGSSTKKYIFTNNSSNPVNIKKGSDKTVTLKASGTTEFTGENKALKEITQPQPLQQEQTSDVDSKGIPTKCTAAGSNPCQLTEEDLKKIKFQVYGEGSEDVTVTPSPSTGTITLTIESSTNKYKFNNTGAEITLKKGSDTSKVVTLKVGETEFTVEGEALKEVVKPTTDDKGIPTRCTTAGATKPCQLSAEELKNIKFKVLEEVTTGSVTLDPTNPNPQITLTIETTPKKYKFTNSSSSAVTLKKGSGGTEKTVVLNSGVTEFTEEGNALKVVEAQKKNNFGIPDSCNLTSGTTTCSLSAEDLKKIKFKDLDGGTVTIDPATLSTNQINLAISAASGSIPKIYTFKNTGSKVTLKKGSEPSKTVVLEKGETEFKEESEKLVIYEENSLKEVNEKIASTLKLPYSCKFKGSEKDKFTKECDVTIDELKKVEFSNKGSGDLNISGQNSGNIKLEIKRLKNSNDVDKEQYGSNIKDDELRVTFKDTTSKITIGNSGNAITIPAKSNMEFQLNSANKLNKSYGLKSLPPGWKVTCDESNKDCTPSNSFIRIFDDSNLSNCRDVTISNQEQAIFTVAEDTDNYNLGYKFTVKRAISGGSVSLTANDTYEIKWSTSQKKWGYVKKTH